MFILPDLYMIYMAVIGGTKVHKISTTRSVIAVVTPLIIVTVLIVAIGFVIFSIGGISLDPSVMSKYNYKIEVSTDSKLENLIFYLPLPVFKDGSKLGDGTIIQNTGNFEGWNLSMIETEHGKMLKITTVKIEPEFHQEKGLSPPGFGQTDDTLQGDVHSFMRGHKEFQVSWTSDHIINITNATDNVPLLVFNNYRDNFCTEFTGKKHGWIVSPSN